MPGVHASPSVRRMAREFGVDLGAVTGTGAKGRITKDDLLGFLRGPTKAPAPAAAAPATGTGIPEIPAQDFSKFGPMETKPLARIKRISGPYLHRSWLNVPHVTHNDEADITDLEAVPQGAGHRSQGRRLSSDAAGLPDESVRLGLEAVPGLQQFAVAGEGQPDPEEVLQYRCRGRHAGRVGRAGRQRCRPQGDRRIDPKSSVTFRRRLATASCPPMTCRAARFTISSLGGIGGTSFTPIVNAPEVAILGVVRSKMSPVWNGSEFVPRMMLPVSLSYDHRVIDGAVAARFTRQLCHLLEDDRRLIL